MYECAFENISIQAVKRLNNQEKPDPTASATSGTNPNLADHASNETSNSTNPELSVQKHHKKTSSNSSKISLPSQTEDSLVTITEKTSFLPASQKPMYVKSAKVNFDEPALSTPVSDTASESAEKQDHSRLSLAEFEISKIWFSFPEPPISPKGKRKIPYTRFDWNLLSSVSPAVTSWLCASKHVMQPLKVSLVFDRFSNV
jgi:hypothetical protein